MIGTKYNKPKTGSKKGEHTTPSKRVPILIDVQFETSNEVIATGVDKYALKRYSRQCQTQLSKDVTTTKPDASNPLLVIPVIGTKAPSKEAVKVVVDWMLTNKNEARPAPLTPEEFGGDLRFKAEVYMACTSFGTTFQPHRVTAHLQGLIHDSAISATDLEALWTLLPRDDRLINAAVQSLTYFYNRNQISSENNAAVEEYFVSQPDLCQKFEDEHHRQKALMSEKPKYKRGSRSGSGKSSTNGGGSRQGSGSKDGASRNGDGEEQLNAAVRKMGL